MSVIDLQNNLERCCRICSVSVGVTQSEPFLGYFVRVSPHPQAICPIRRPELSGGSPLTSAPSVLIALQCTRFIVSSDELWPALATNEGGPGQREDRVEMSANIACPSQWCFGGIFSSEMPPHYWLLPFADQLIMISHKLKDTDECIYLFYPSSAADGVDSRQLCGHRRCHPTSKLYGQISFLSSTLQTSNHNSWMRLPCGWLHVIMVWWGRNQI